MKLRPISRGVLTSVAAAPLFVQGSSAYQNIAQPESSWNIKDGRTVEGTFAASDVGSVSLTTTLSYRIEQTWDESAKKRFRELAKKEALDQINKVEMHELAVLTDLRRAEENPMPAEEYFAEKVRAKRTQRLLEALNEFFGKL